MANVLRIKQQLKKYINLNDKSKCLNPKIKDKFKKSR